MTDNINQEEQQNSEPALTEQQTETPVQFEQVQEGSQPASADGTQAESSKSGLGAKVGGAVGIMAVLFKFKGLLFILLAKLKYLFVGFKYFKFAKVFTTFGSMLFTIVIDAMRWGWAFAFGFVMLLFVHEMGHAWAIRRKGIEAGAPVFIPFVGALISLKENPQDAKTEAEIAIAGPLLGTAGAFLCFYLGMEYRMELLVRLSYVGFFLNLFNLLPVLPLDGGRVMSAISPKVWIVGLVLAALIFFKTHNPIFLILIIMSIGRTWHDMKSSKENLEYYNVPKSTRIQMTAAYFGLAGFLGFMLMILHHPRF